MQHLCRIEDTVLAKITSLFFLGEILFVVLFDYFTACRISESVIHLACFVMKAVLGE